MLLSPYHPLLPSVSTQKPFKTKFSGHQPTHDEIKTGKEWVNADLQGAEFYTNWCLDSSVFAGANLKDTTFHGNRLYKANFVSSNLSGAVMKNINASQANFSSTKTETGTKADFSNAFLENANFTTASLNTAAFTKSTLSQASLKSASLENANFDNARATNASFDNISAQSSSFFDSILNNSRFTDAKLDNAKFIRSNIRSTKFNNASLKGANLKSSIGTESDFRGAKLHNANLEHSILDGAKFNLADLTGANMSNTSLENANLKEADLERVNLQNTKAVKANFSWVKNGNGIQINSSILDGANFYTAYLPKAQFASSHLNEAFLQGAILDGAKMQQIQARGSDFKGAHLSEAILSASELPQTNFIGADLNKADLTMANLNNARLAAAQLKETKFINSNLNNSDISSTKLDGTTFANSDIQKALFINTEGADTDFSDCNLEGSKFIASKFLSPNFWGSNLNRCIFNHTALFLPNLTNIKAAQAEFKGVSISVGQLNNSSFPEANFESSKIKNSHFDNADFSQANFSESELTESSLKHANFTGANLNKAKLTGSDLTGANLREANLAGAQLAKVNLSNTDLSKVKNIKLADFEGSYYKDGFKPTLPDGITPNQLGIHKVKDEESPKSGTSQGKFFSLYSNKQFDKLAKQANQGNNREAKAEYAFFKYLAQGKNSTDWMKEFINEEEHIDNALETLRNSYKGQEVSDAYIPESRNGRSADDEESSLQLDNFLLKTEDGTSYPDLNTFKDICLAQQLYSNYLAWEKDDCSSISVDRLAEAFKDSPEETFWLDRLKNAFEEDYGTETGRSSSSEDEDIKFLEWLREKYRLYDANFDFNRTLEAAYTVPEVDEKIGFASVMGYSKVKNKLKEQIITPLTFPMISQAGPAKPQKGWIFYGEPGTGKSHFANAVSGQIGLRPVEISLSSIGSSYENQTVRNLTTQFEKAKRLAQRHGASVVLLDEMNQVGDNRQKGGTSKSDLTNSLLNMITKYVEQAKENIICIGTTNDIKAVDPALKRAGRLGAHEEIDAPDKESREAYLNQELPQGDHFLKPLDLYEGGRDEMIDYIADKTEGKPTSALKLLVNRLTGGYKDNVTKQDVDNALEQIKLDLKKQI